MVTKIIYNNMINEEEIEDWLYDKNIRNFKINKDLSVDINQDADFYNYSFDYLPFKINTVNGNLVLPEKIISLINCPYETKGNFDASYSNIKTLEYCTSIIRGDFIINHSKNLKSLKYCPSIIEGNFKGNNLISLKSLKYITQIIGGDVTLNDCDLISFQYLPSNINGDLIVSNNKINSMLYCPKIINGEFDFSNNNIQYLNNSPKSVKRYSGDDNPIIDIMGITEDFEELYINTKNIINFGNIDENSKVFNVIMNGIEYGMFTYLPKLNYVVFLKNINVYDFLTNLENNKYYEKNVEPKFVGFFLSILNGDLTEDEIRNFITKNDCTKMSIRARSTFTHLMTIYYDVIFGHHIPDDIYGKIK